MSIPICRDCKAALGQEAEKALSGEVQMVWADLLTGEWVCPKTGNEHVQVWRVDSEPKRAPADVPTEPGAFIVVEGNPVDGFVYHGIPAFAEHDDATAWAEENCTVEWWVAPLQDVE